MPPLSCSKAAGNAASAENFDIVLAVSSGSLREAPAMSVSGKLASSHFDQLRRASLARAQPLA